MESHIQLEVDRQADKLTPLGLAISTKNLNLQVIDKLLAAGADPNAKDDYGYSPLRYAGTNTVIQSKLRAKGATG